MSVREAAVITGGGQAVVRRILLLAILFALITISATGVSGLVERLIDVNRAAVDGVAPLARSLAFALIGAPLSGALWWWQRRRLALAMERASLLWALYVAATTLVALIMGIVGLGSAAAAAVDGEWRPDRVATGVVWSGVWIWHSRIAARSATAPTRQGGATLMLGEVFGILVAAMGLSGVISGVLSEALSGVAAPVVDWRSWWVPVAQSAVWAASGTLVWWWHRRRERVPGMFTEVVLVMTVGAAAATALFSSGVALHVLLRLLFDDGPVLTVIAPLASVIAAGLVGAFVWLLYVSDVGRFQGMAAVVRLVVSGIALSGAASGFGVIVNALLGALATPLVGGDLRSLLLGGVSALVIGTPVWWATWRPTRPATAETAGAPSRRVYLVLVFGASAIVAIVTLLTLGFRLFSAVLGADEGGLVDRIRAPIGLLLATTTVFAYHFAVWRRARAIAPAATRPTKPERLVLVVAGDGAELVDRVREVGGVRTTVWQVEDEADGLRPGDAAAVLEAVSECASRRVLVVAEPAGGIRVIPLSQ